MKVRDGQKTKRHETIKELLDQEKGRVKLMWISSHSESRGTRRQLRPQKNALEENIND
jgi:hypothetical protein